MFKPLAAQEKSQATPQVIRRGQSSIPSMLAAIPERWRSGLMGLSSIAKAPVSHGG